MTKHAVRRRRLAVFAKCSDHCQCQYLFSLDSLSASIEGDLWLSGTRHTSRLAPGILRGETTGYFIVLGIVAAHGHSQWLLFQLESGLG